MNQSISNKIVLNRKPKKNRQIGNRIQRKQKKEQQSKEKHNISSTKIQTPQRSVYEYNQKGQYIQKYEYMYKNEHNQNDNKEQAQKLGSIFNYPNISLIVQKHSNSSFMSNNKDSLDSIDQIIFEVGGKSEENSCQSDSSLPNWSYLHSEFEQLFYKKAYLHKKNEGIILQQIQEYKQDNSNRFLGNLSDIYKQHKQNSQDGEKEKEIKQEEFSGFEEKQQQDMEQNQNNAIKAMLNISKIMNKNSYLDTQNKGIKEGNQIMLKTDRQPEQDDLVQILTNELNTHQRDFSLKKQGPNNKILKDLSVEENLELNGFYRILKKREEWILSRNERSNEWKKRELWLLIRMRKIIQNPYMDEEEDDSIFGN